ncbi:MAG: ABC transporter permease [Actinomycetota bacterium]|nr:ABC transporter permease [Actinomycetota bacterium]
MSGGHSLSVVRGVASRNARGLLKLPAKLLPPILVPLFFFIAFKGAFSALGDAKGFDYYDFTAFIFVVILYMAGMFSGAFTAIDILVDYESGLGRRLMAAVPRRMAIVYGYLIVGIARGLVAMAVVWGVVLATGMPVRGDAPDIAALVLLALLLNIAATLFGAGVALRFQSVGAGTLIFIPTFITLFLTPLFAERDSLSAVLKAAAGVNPLTPPIEAGRGFLADDPVNAGLAFGCAGGLVIAFALWALLGMRKAERGA